MASNHEADLFVRSLPRRQVVSSAGFIGQIKCKSEEGAIVPRSRPSLLLLFFARATSRDFRDRIFFRLTTDSVDFFLSDDFLPQKVKVFFCESPSLYENSFFAK